MTFNNHPDSELGCNTISRQETNSCTFEAFNIHILGFGKKEKHREICDPRRFSYGRDILYSDFHESGSTGGGTSSVVGTINQSSEEFRDSHVPTDKGLDFILHVVLF